MPKTLADARIKLSVLTAAPAATTGIPSVTELTAGVNVSCRIMKSDFRLSPTASDTVADQELCHEGNAVTYGASNYEGTVTPFRYLDDTGVSDADNDIAWTTFGTKGAELWIVKRVGPKYDQEWAATDIIDVFHVITDNPQDPSDLTGYIKKTVPLGVQDALLDVTVVAGS